MPQPIIEVKGISKRYRLGQYNAMSLREEAELFFARLRGDGARRESARDFWALKDISFSVEPGEVVGIIGKNGAGKSTLLKILSRITEPTEGEVRVRGRAASLLEVGTGFHPELSGRENIYLNGAILGMSRAEIKRKFDEIVDFSGVEKFLDTPVKRYSSGMYVRLAFAVAAHLEPEILIVDEVLAVGDADFQKKCLGKMEKIASQSGRTILFVSHNMAAISSLCGRAIYLKDGATAQEGAPGDVIEAYLTQGAQKRHLVKRWSFEEAPGDDRFKVVSISVVPASGGEAGTIGMETPFDIELQYWNLKSDQDLHIELIVRARDGTPVFHSYSTEDITHPPLVGTVGMFYTSCAIPGGLLNAGNYDIEAYFSDGRPAAEFAVADAIAVTISDFADRGNLCHLGQFIGHVHPKLKWQTRLIEDEQLSREASEESAISG